MKKWEYRVINVKAKRRFLTSQFDLKEIEEKMNSMGQQGWELVKFEGLSNRYAISPILTFKRPI